MGPILKRLLLAIGIVIVLGLTLVVCHLALIEIGREVVTLRTPTPDGGERKTRLWIVDDVDGAWLHSAGRHWLKRFEGDPLVEVDRGGETGIYRAHAVPGPHPRIDQLLRKKYGFADRWVRFLAPCGEDTVPVHLEPVRRPE
jgi:hypothetical protein